MNNPPIVLIIENTQRHINTIQEWLSMIDKSIKSLVRWCLVDGETMDLVTGEWLQKVFTKNKVSLVLLDADIWTTTYQNKIIQHSWPALIEILGINMDGIRVLPTTNGSFSNGIGDAYKKIWWDGKTIIDKSSLNYLERNIGISDGPGDRDKIRRMLEIS